MNDKLKIGVFCTEVDLQEPLLIRIAIKANIIKVEDVVNGKVTYTEKQLRDVLYNLFGFDNEGWYEEEFFETQRARFGNKVIHNAKRYVGVERMDMDWVEGGMCSSQVREIVKFGTILDDEI